MSKKAKSHSILVGLMLGMLGLTLLLTGWITPHWSLNLHDPTATDILNLVLKSHTLWNTAAGTSEVVWYGEDGTTQRYVTEFAFEQPAKANVTLTEAPDFIEKTSFISDGEATYEINLVSKTYTQGYLPSFAYDTSMLPKDLSETQEEYSYPHPMNLLTPFPVAEYMFPTWFSQGNKDAVYTVTGEEQIAGRNTWVVNVEIRNDHVTAWIDQETGVILKYTQITDEKLFEEYEVLTIEFDGKLSKTNFVVSEDLTPAQP